ncbi:phosphatase [Lachnospiraceae bacterium LCP25S3_G4]
MIKLDVHTHSISSGHATTDTIEMMAKSAASIGIELLGISDHGPATKGSCSASYYRNLALAPRQRAGIHLLYGVELNILDGEDNRLDLDNDILCRLDYAIASMHIQTCAPGTITQNTNRYIKAMENPYVKILGHCDDPKYPVDYQALVEAAKSHHILLELNNTSLSPCSYRGDTTWNNEQLLSYCEKYQHPIILSSDSHGTVHVGNVEYAEHFIEKMGFPKKLVLNYDVSSFLTFLNL